MLGRISVVEEDLKPVRLETVHLTDEAAEGGTATDWREGETIGVDALHLGDESVAVIVEQR